MNACPPDHHRSRPHANRSWEPSAVQIEPAIGSPDWWLTHAPQFLVDDDAQQPIGILDEVQIHPDTGRPHALVVVLGWGRRWVVIPIDAVADIQPAHRRLIVRRATRHRWLYRDRRLLRRAGGALRSFGSRGQ